MPCQWREECPPPPPHMMAGPPPPMGMPLQNPNAAPVSRSRRVQEGKRHLLLVNSNNDKACLQSLKHDNLIMARGKPQLHHSLPPSGPRGRASSTDSIEVPPPPRPQRRDGASLPPPPPPPPPPPMNQYHIRADSSGSISSIGSTGKVEEPVE